MGVCMGPVTGCLTAGTGGPAIRKKRRQSIMDTNNYVLPEWARAENLDRIVPQTDLWRIR